MVDVKISDLVELTAPAAGDQFVVNDISEPVDADKTKYITLANILSAAGAFSVQAVIGDGVNAITTTPAVRGWVSVPVAATITGWTIVGDVAGSIVVDVWKDTYANFPPENADSIAGTEKPTLSAQDKNQDLTLSSWTTAVAAGDILAFEVESAATVTLVTLILHMTKV